MFVCKVLNLMVIWLGKRIHKNNGTVKLKSRKPALKFKALENLQIRLKEFVLLIFRVKTIKV